MIEYFYNLVSFEAADSRFSARVELVQDNPIYKAHFPGHPITPGACQLEIVRAVTSKAAGKDVTISSMKSIKYLSAVDPLQTKGFTVEGQLSPDGDRTKCMASVVDGDTVFTKVSFFFN